MNTKDVKKHTSTLLYDGACPICISFVSSFKNCSSVNLINARQPSEHLAKAHQLNLNINNGAVVFSGNQAFYGAKAITHIVQNHKTNGLKGQVLKTLFYCKPIAHVIYPIAVALRRLLLFARGTPLIKTSSTFTESNPHKTTNNGLKVYYNSACPVCDAGIKGQKNKMAQCQVQWFDIHTDPNSVKDVNSELEFVRKRLHVVNNAGDVKIGIDAFIALWQTSPGEQWKAKLFSLPIVHGLSQWLYNGFAWCLYRYNRVLKHW